MRLVLLTPDLIEAIHDEVLFPGELAGRARDKSLEGALARIDHRIAYGMIEDDFDLAATYAMAIATGHCFNDGNKRTAFRTMNAALSLNGVELEWNVEDIGPRIVSLAQGLIDDQDLAAWLRGIGAPRA